MHDLVEHSEAAGDIVQGEEVGGAMLRLRDVHVRARLPRPDARAPSTRRSSACCAALFDWYCEHPEELPRGARRDEADRVIDYLAGMTDRFAIRAWTERAVPAGLR